MIVGEEGHMDSNLFISQDLERAKGLVASCFDEELRECIESNGEVDTLFFIVEQPFDGPLAHFSYDGGVMGEIVLHSQNSPLYLFNEYAPTIEDIEHEIERVNSL